jgi:hypothetical protein
MMRIFIEAQRVQREEEELASKKAEVCQDNTPVEEPLDKINDPAQDDDQLNFNPRGRRQHCFLYIFKKISS